MNTKPTVSIICLTFNQEKYVRDCFEGFVMQQTSFPFEVLVYDDASTDGTPAIIREFAANYPDIFKPTLYEKNNYSQGLGYVGLYTGIKVAQGKYVAYCEGDDYWTDVHKLQKQVDFLESHSDYEICAHDVTVKYADGKAVQYSEFENNLFISVKNNDYTFEDILTGNIFHVSSLMYRNFPIELPCWLPRISAGDMVLYRLLGEKGKLHILPDAMSVYRDHKDSLTNSQKEYNSKFRYYQTLSIPVLRLLNLFWERRYQDKIYPIIAVYYAECAILYTNKGIRDLNKSKQMAKIACYYSVPPAICHLFKGLVKKIIRRLS